MNRFDFETELVNCWKIIDDIRLARERFELNDKKDNYLLGLETIYEERFDKLFSMFEELVYKGDFK